MNQRSVLTLPEGRPTAPIIVIEKRALVRESLARRLRQEFNCQVVSFPDIDSWQKGSPRPEAQFILVSAWENDHEALHALRASETGAALIVLSDTTELDDVVRSLKGLPSFESRGADKSKEEFGLSVWPLKALDLFGENAAAILDLAIAVAKAKSLSDVIELQSSFVSERYSMLVRQTNEIAELTRRFTFDVSARFG